MVMTQDTLDKTRSEFSYVFSRSPHHFSLPLLIRIHQACTRQQPFSFLVPPFFFFNSEFFYKRKKNHRGFTLFPKGSSQKKYS